MIEEIKDIFEKHYVGKFETLTNVYELKPIVEDILKYESSIKYLKDLVVEIDEIYKVYAKLPFEGGIEAKRLLEEQMAERSKEIEKAVLLKYGRD